MYLLNIYLFLLQATLESLTHTATSVFVGFCRLLFLPSFCRLLFLPGFCQFLHIRLLSLYISDLLSFLYIELYVQILSTDFSFWFLLYDILSIHIKQSKNPTSYFSVIYMII